MHKAYHLLHVIAREIRDEIRDHAGEKLRSANHCLIVSDVCLPLVCFECHGEEAWAAKLGEILQRHNVDLQQFIQEVGGDYPEGGGTQFQLVEGKLHYAWGDHFWTERLLFHIARVLPVE